VLRSLAALVLACAAAGLFARARGQADRAVAPLVTPPRVAAPAPPGAVGDWRTLVGGAGPESVPVRDWAGVPSIAIGDFARLLDATKFWRGDLRKLELRARNHRLQLTVDNPFVVIDDHTVRLDAGVRSVAGELLVPVALVDSLPRDSTLARLYFDAARGVVLRVPPGGLITGPRIAVEGGVTRLTFPADRPDEVVAAGRARAHFRVRFSGFYAGELPATIPDGSLARAVRPIATAGGSAFEIEVAPEAAGFRLVSDVPDHRVTLTLERTPSASLEAFAPEGPSGPRALRVIVLDPGHGGSDAGVTVQGAVEKDLTLRLARLVKAEIERRSPVRVVLTREDDHDASEDDRAERANRAHADLVIALHFDGLPGGRARGATAYCPPATFASSQREAQGSGLIAMLPWRDVALRHAVAARELSEDLLSALELRAQGPTRLREILPYPILGVNAPGLLLECGTLTSATDRARILGPHGLSDLATTLADGIEAWQRNP
jgi:N-acetylmuramoyl-L-alanine amidase